MKCGHLHKHANISLPIGLTLRRKVQRCITYLFIIYSAIGDVPFKQIPISNWYLSLGVLTLAFRLARCSFQAFGSHIIRRKTKSSLKVCCAFTDQLDHMINQIILTFQVPSWNDQHVDTKQETKCSHLLVFFYFLKCPSTSPLLYVFCTFGWSKIIVTE